jgi:hypothetical protein
MKKYIVSILIILCLSVLCWAQAAKAPFDVKKAQAELEIMKGILGTTAKYVAKNYQKNTWPWNSSNISAYYLAGQGTVFVIPTSGFRSSIGIFRFEDSGEELELLRQREFEIYNREVEENMRHLEENMRQFKTQAALDKSAGKDAESPSLPPVRPIPPIPPPPPEPPAPPAPPQINREELRTTVERLQANIKKSREEEEANREKFLRSLSEIKIYLIEALANYGDSISTLKPDEYINLIFLTDKMDSDYGGMKTQHDIISVQKSWITDYKAGRLSLDGFKQKALQYTE